MEITKDKRTENFIVE